MSSELGCCDYSILTFSFIETSMGQGHLRILPCFFLVSLQVCLELNIKSVKLDKEGHDVKENICEEDIVVKKFIPETTQMT